MRELTRGEVTDETITEANLTATASRTAVLGRRPEGERWRRLLASDHFPALVLAVVTAVIMIGTQTANAYFLSGFNIRQMLTLLGILCLHLDRAVDDDPGRWHRSLGRALSGLMVVLASFLTPDDASIGRLAIGSAAILAFATLYGWFQGCWSQCFVCRPSS